MFTQIMPREPALVFFAPMPLAMTLVSVQPWRAILSGFHAMGRLVWVMENSAFPGDVVPELVAEISFRFMQAFAAVKRDLHIPISLPTCVCRWCSLFSRCNMWFFTRLIHHGARCQGPPQPEPVLGEGRAAENGSWGVVRCGMPPLPFSRVVCTCQCRGSMRQYGTECS